ncbi:MAG TPA: hypothetical protein VGM05_29655 [Planctomycetaceae bacterium]|jgi:hypothetical protein
MPAVPPPDIGGVHAQYATLLDQLIAEAVDEKRQEQERRKRRQAEEEGPEEAREERVAAMHPEDIAFWVMLVMSVFGLLASTVLYHPIAKFERMIGLPSFLTPAGKLRLRITTAVVSLLGLVLVATLHWLD